MTPSSAAIELANAALRLPSDTRGPLSDALKQRSDAATTPWSAAWRAVGHFLERVEDAEEQRLLVAATSETSVPTSATLTALAFHARPVVEAVEMLRPPVREAMASALIPAPDTDLVDLHMALAGLLAEVGW